jgi:uncharacterized membrane protein YdjX (TVP38/TMEM64 family)
MVNKLADLKGLWPLLFVTALSVGFHLFGGALLGGRLGAFTQGVEHFVTGLGFAGYGIIVAAYALCSFFFIPLLIPLNIASGALYGPYVGTAVAVASITAGSAASAVSVRHVFTGMHEFVEKRPGAEKILRHVGSGSGPVVLLLRLAFIVPYLWQNVALALAPIPIKRLVALTALGSVPGAAVYSLLGAGLVKPGDLHSLALYAGIPLLLLGAAVLAAACLKRR